MVKNVGTAVINGAEWLVIGDKVISKNGNGIFYDAEKSTIEVLDPTIRVWFGISSPPLCGDCQREAHPYMVHDVVWLAAGMTHATGSQLCLPCLEARLNRPLARMDFQTLEDHGHLNLWIKWPHGKLALVSPREAWSVMRRNECKGQMAWVNLSGNKSGWPKEQTA